MPGDRDAAGTRRARRREGALQLVATARVALCESLSARVARRDKCRSDVRAHAGPGDVACTRPARRRATVIAVRFKASGTDGSKMPAARGYLVKQSRRPIRTAADFERAAALCQGTCSVDVTRPGATITLTIKDLRRHTDLLLRGRRPRQRHGAARTALKTVTQDEVTRDNAPATLTATAVGSTK